MIKVKTNTNQNKVKNSLDAMTDIGKEKVDM